MGGRQAEPEGAEPADAVPVEVLVATVREANQLISIVDDRGVIAYANDGFARYGYRPADVVGNPPLDFVHPDDLERAMTGVAVLGRTKSSMPMTFRLRRGDGSYEVVLVGSSLITAADRQWIVFDMTPIPVHNTTERTLAALGEGRPAEEALEVLATGLTEMGAGLVVGIALDTEGGRSVVGPLAPDLAGVVGGRQDRSPGTAWGEALATGSVASREVGGGAADSGDLPVAPAGDGFRAVTVLPIDDPGTDLPALMVVWYQDSSLKDFVDLFLAAVPVDIVRIALHGRRQRQDLERQAVRDGLTGLANRRAFFAALDRLAEFGGSTGTDDRAGTAAVLYLDLDDFKPVNDRFGHDAGDRLLVEMGRRFTAAVRPTDLVARLGGDEFAVLLTGDVDEAEARAVGERLVSAAAEPVDTPSGPVAAGASVGIAVVPAHRLADVRALLRTADELLLQAKRVRKGTVEVVVVD